MKVIGISGSLRSASVNTSLLRAAASLTLYNVELVVYDELGNLPHFNPEHQKAAIERGTVTKCCSKLQCCTDLAAERWQSG